MQLASSGLRALKGGQANRFPPGGGQPSRSIHIPAFAPLPSSQSSTTAQAVFRQTRNLISRFVAHLTAPSTLRTPLHLHVAANARPFHMSAARMPTIQERLSLPARHILSKPLAVPFLPRPPAVPRHISQVGLGTARNFSSGRPIFQHLVENVPVYARAFNEADWEIRIEEERQRLRMEKQKARRVAKEMKKAKAPLRPLKQNVVAAPAPGVAESQKEEFDHYFPAPTSPEVTTHLLIPLAPTPTSRLPLPLNPPAMSSTHPLLPLDVIASMHASHGTHALRVSTVFARLDVAKVFDEPGVHCEARGDPSGLCTVLEVRFEGWTAHKVRGVLGEAGTGWCVLEEVWHDQAHAEAEEMDAALEALSTSGSESMHDADLSLSGLSGINGSWGSNTHGIDPAQSFVLPTLDFSASFSGSSWSPPASTHGTRSRTSSSTMLGSWSDGESDVGSATDSDWFELSSAPSNDRRKEDITPHNALAPSSPGATDKRVTTLGDAQSPFFVHCSYEVRRHQTYCFCLTGVVLARQIDKVVQEPIPDPSTELMDQYRWIQCTLKNETQFDVLPLDTYMDSGRYWAAPDRLAPFTQMTFSACDQGIFSGATGGTAFRVWLDGEHYYDFSWGWTAPAIGSFKAAVVESDKGVDGYNAANDQHGSLVSRCLFEGKDRLGWQTRFRFRVSAEPGQKALFVVKQVSEVD
ncbi:hypothetical protein C8Q76DRAFT_693423 [Earliella scabrosa]|nr:hypothetical protein C8Q76DRAFT_693423 [Earliella scabrosa]